MLEKSEDDNPAPYSLLTDYAFLNEPSVVWEPAPVGSDLAGQTAEGALRAFEFGQFAPVDPADQALARQKLQAKEDERAQQRYLRRQQAVERERPQEEQRKKSSIGNKENGKNKEKGISMPMHDLTARRNTTSDVIIHEKRTLLTQSSCPSNTCTGTGSLTFFEATDRDEDVTTGGTFVISEDTERDVESDPLPQLFPVPVVPSQLAFPPALQFLHLALLLLHYGNDLRVQQTPLRLRLSHRTKIDVPRSTRY
ncbi:hypothetical protein BDN67DRAFT_1016671 [Paxillus ammoniavirescens]|nr:hypothetical protein BDN67DRAFT_1016671 [Paxillus ammoniavirescens]